MTTRGNETLDFPGMDLSQVLRTAAGKTRRVRSADALQTSGQLIPAAGDVGANEARTGSLRPYVACLSRCRGLPTSARCRPRPVRR